MQLRSYRRRIADEVVTIDVDAPLGAGGEARVFPVGDAREFVAKIYHHPEPRRFAKLEVMIANPPEIPVGLNGHVMIAWPLDLLEDPDTGEAIGFLMDRVDDVRLLIDFYNPKNRREVAPGFHPAYLLRAARNLAVSVAALHARGYVIGDLNESNILAKETALVTLVDLDSIQVRDPDTQEVYRSRVGKVEYTAPELQGQAYDAADRTEEQDCFALSVLIFQLLMEGAHPFVGSPTAMVEAKPLGTRIQEGLYPYHGSRDTGYAPRAVTPKIESLYPEIQDLLRQCFEDGHLDPTRRPTALQWAATVQAAEAQVRTCGRNSQHRFSEHQAACPWCARAERLNGYDSFPPRTGSQRSAPEMEAAIAKRGMLQQRRQRERHTTRVAAVALPMVLGIGILLYSWMNSVAAAEHEPVTRRDPGPAVGSPADPSPGSANPETASAPASPDPDPDPDPDPEAEPETADPQPVTRLEPAEQPPPKRASGTLVAAVDPVQTGLLRVRPRLGGDAGKIGYTLQGRLGDAAIHAVTSTHEAVWFSTDKGLLRFTPKTGRWGLIDATTDLESRPYRAIAGCSAGLVCTVGDDPGTTNRLSPRTMIWWEIAEGARSIAPHDDILWLATGRGVVRANLYGGLPIVFGRDSGHLPSDDVTAVRRIDETLWVTRRGQDGGVSRLDIATADWRDFAAGDGLAHNTAVDLAIDKNAVWVVHDAPGLSRFDRSSQTWRVIRESKPHPDGRPGIPLVGRCVTVERDVNVWIGGDALLWYGVKTGRANPIARFKGRTVADVAVAHGDVWALFSGTGGSVIVRVLANRGAKRGVDRRERKSRNFYDQHRALRSTEVEPESRRAIAAGVSWLVRHQDRGGRFDSDGFMRHDRTGQPSVGRGGATNDIGVTALAVLALLADRTSKDAPRRRAAERGAAWLVARMQSGRIGVGNGRSFMYGQAMATLALCEAYGAYGNIRVRQAAQAAVGHLQKLHRAGAGWRYPSSNGSDASVTAWAIEALTTAADVGLKVDVTKIAAAIHWLDTVTDAAGRTGYTGVSVAPFRFRTEAKAFPGRNSEATTAAALYARFLAGQRPERSEQVRQAVDRLAQRTPVFGPGSVDLIEWYFTVHAFTGLGPTRAGTKVQPAGFQGLLVQNQRRDGNSTGSWDPIGVWGRAGGRIYATAMSLLILQAAQRTDRREFARHLSADPRLDGVRRSAGKSYPELSAAFGKLGRRFQAKNWSDRGYLLRIQRELQVAIGAGNLAVQRAERRRDPLAAGRVLTRLAAQYAGLPPGKRAATRLQALRADPSVARELDAERSLTGLRKTHRNRASKGYRQALERFLQQFAGTATADAVIDEVMRRNAHRGMARRPAGARLLDNSLARSVTYSFALAPTAKQHLALELPATWREDIGKSVMQFVTVPPNQADRAELTVKLHRGKTFKSVSDFVQRRVDRTKVHTTRKIDGVSNGVLRMRKGRAPTRTWTYRTKFRPVADKRVLLVQIDDVLVEFEHTHRKGRSDWDRILKSLKVRTGVVQDKAFQIKSGDWLFEATNLGRIRRHLQHQAHRLVFDQLDRRGKVTGQWTFRAIAVDKRPLAKVIAATQRGSWSAAMHASNRGLHWLVYTSRTPDQQHRLRAYARIPGQLDLSWEYKGREDGDGKLDALLTGLRGRGPREAH